jgi:hypothetical protein
MRRGHAVAGQWQETGRYARPPAGADVSSRCRSWTARRVFFEAAASPSKSQLNLDTPRYRILRRVESRRHRRCTAGYRSGVGGRKPKQFSTAAEVIDSYFDFAQQILTSQREFAHRIIAATKPAAE